jgi:predicted ferric reductase
MSHDRPDEPNYDTSLNASSVLVLILAVALGLLAAFLVIPNWLPGLAGSLSGAEPKAYWYLSRATGLVALGILWASMMLGVGISNKMAQLWPGSPAAFALHEYLSLLGLGFAGFHGLILLGDHYTNFNLVQVLLPFATGNYKPVWVGLGQLGFYSWALVAVSFYVRKRIGMKPWRVLHYLSFLTYAGAVVHGLLSGTDSNLPWVQGFYWLTVSSFLFLLIARIVNSLVLRIEKRLEKPTI